MGNGDLLTTAIRERYDVFVTTDQNLKHQHNLTEVHLGIAVLLSTSWPRIRSRVEDPIVTHRLNLKGMVQRKYRVMTALTKTGVRMPKMHLSDKAWQIVEKNVGIPL